jgi:hypothetical protein
MMKDLPTAAIDARPLRHTAGLLRRRRQTSTLHATGEPGLLPGSGAYENASLQADSSPGWCWEKCSAFDRESLTPYSSKPRAHGATAR